MLLLGVWRWMWFLVVIAIATGLAVVAVLVVFVVLVEMLRVWRISDAGFFLLRPRRGLSIRGRRVWLLGMRLVCARLGGSGMLVALMFLDRVL